MEFSMGRGSSNIIWLDGIVCSPLTSGGLGIRKLATFNQSLLDKWLW